MKTTDALQQIIVNVLNQGHHVTTDQLHALVNAELIAIGAQRATKQRFTANLRLLAAAGYIVKDRDNFMARYRMPSPPRYRWRRILDACIVEREHPAIAGHWNDIGNMTEAEAITCVTALNALDRQARGIKQS